MNDVTPAPRNAQVDVLAVMDREISMCRDAGIAEVGKFAEFIEARALIAELIEAATKAKSALLTGQPEIRGDDTVYPLDGAKVGNALTALRTILSKLSPAKG